jgi:hypothetical protein
MASRPPLAVEPRLFLLDLPVLLKFLPLLSSFTLAFRQPPDPSFEQIQTAKSLAGHDLKSYGQKKKKMPAVHHIHSFQPSTSAKCAKNSKATPYGHRPGGYQHRKPTMTLSNHV